METSSTAKENIRWMKNKKKKKTKINKRRKEKSICNTENFPIILLFYVFFLFFFRCSVRLVGGFVCRFYCCSFLSLPFTLSLRVFFFLLFLFRFLSKAHSTRLILARDFILFILMFSPYQFRWKRI